MDDARRLGAIPSILFPMSDQVPSPVLDTRVPFTRAAAIAAGIEPKLLRDRGSGGSSEACTSTRP